MESRLKFPALMARKAAAAPLRVTLVAVLAVPGLLRLARAASVAAAAV